MDSPDDSGVPVDFYRLCCASRCGDFTWEDGSYEHVPTWHEKESGIGLVGDRVILSTEDPEAGPASARPDCYAVTIMADKDSSVALDLQVDLKDDEDAFHETGVPADGWTVSKFEYRAPSDSAEMRFRLKKTGSDRAVLYYLEIDGIYHCSKDAVTIDP